MSGSATFALLAIFGALAACCFALSSIADKLAKLVERFPPPPEGHDAPVHVCDHGFRGDSCGICAQHWEPRP